MQQKGIAFGLVCCSLNLEVINRIQISSFEIEKDTWVDTVFSEHYADILYSASIKNTPGKIYFLFEHKSYTDHRTSRQILRYQNQIWDQLEQQDPKMSKMPVIVPIIVYHGKKPWNIVNSTKPLFAIIKGTERHVPDFRSVIVDLNVLDIERCSHSVVLTAFLSALKYSGNPKLFTVPGPMVRSFSGLENSETQYLAEVLLYLGAVIPKDKRDLFLEIIKREHRDGVTIMKTIADSFRDEGIQIGVERGRKQGREEGKMIDKIEIARKLLKKGWI